MKLSVVIATKDRASFLTRALDSLAQQTDAPAFEAIVVDNGSSDETAALVDGRIGTEPYPLARVFVPEPNRGAARNRGVARADGDVVVFVDDDVVLPAGFLSAHAQRHDAAGAGATTVAGPILNVPSYDVRPSPTPANGSRAFFCTCNASVGRAAFESVGGFDERFDLYGWEDTELGIRLRRSGVRRTFAWDAYLYHIKPPSTETLDALVGKAREKGRMAARLLAKDSSLRTRLATGAHAPNLIRAAVLVPSASLGWYERLARSERAPGAVRAVARGALLDGAYVEELRAALRASSR